MKSFIISLIAGMLMSTTASAQPGPDTLWTRFYGWTGDDTAFSLKKTADGGFIIAGTATVPADGHTNAFLIKTDSNGVMQGAHSYGGDYDQGAYSVAVTYDGGYALAGYTTGASGYRGLYYVRVNILGDPLCTFSEFSGNPLVHVWFTAVEGMQDNTLIAAYGSAHGLGGDLFAGLTWFPALDCNFIDGWGPYWGQPIKVHNAHRTSDPGIAFVGQWADTVGDPLQACLWRETLAGTLRHAYGGNGYDDEAFDFVETLSGFFLAGASSDGQITGIFLCKADTAGNQDWIHRFFIAPLDQWVEAIVPAIGGGYVLAGTMVTYWGDTDMLLAKVNDDGQIVWQKSYGTDADERAYDLVQTADGGFVLVGYSTAHVGVQAEWYIVKTLPDPELAAPDIGNPVPQQYTLSAFPNPFNPTTTLLFSLPWSRRVDLSVYDVSGRLVRCLIANQTYSPGNHAITFDASALPSGIYFARLDAGAFTQTKKLMLLK